MNLISGKAHLNSSFALALSVDGHTHTHTLKLIYRLSLPATQNKQLSSYYAVLYCYEVEKKKKNFNERYADVIVEMV